MAAAANESKEPIKKYSANSFWSNFLNRASDFKAIITATPPKLLLRIKK